MSYMPLMPPMPGINIKNILKKAEEINRAENKALRQMFGPFIKESFLIKMKEKISKTNEFNDLVLKVYDVMDFSQQRMLYGFDNYCFDLCKFITAVHNNNTIYMSDSEKASIQNDIKYQEKLKALVLKMVALRRFGTINLAKGSLEGYCPMPYIVNVINNYMGQHINDAIDKKTIKNVKNKYFKIQMLTKMIAKIKACMVLIDNQLVEEAFNPLRSLLELLMIYLCLGNSEKAAIVKYTKYVRYSIDYQRTREIPEEVKNDYTDNVKNKDINIIDYLNYGWLDEVLEFCYIEKDKRTYRIKDLVEILDMKYARTAKVKVGSQLYKIYRDCNPMSHGFNIAIQAYNSKMDICAYLGSLINFIMPEIEKVCDISYQINNIRLKPLLNEILEDSGKIINKIKSNKELMDKVNSPYLRIVS